MSKVVDGNEYLIVKEVAQLLRRSTTCVYRASDPDSPDPLPRIRIKRTLLYEVEDLRNWISRHKVESGDKLPAEMATLETGGFECLGGVTRLALSVSE